MRLYKHMKRRLAKKRLGWLWLPKEKVPKVGEIYNDCDGFNHRLTRIDGIWPAQWGRGWVLVDVDYYREDGRLFCGCQRLHLGSAASPEWVENYIRGCYDVSPEWIEQQRKAGWWNTTSDRRREFVLTGGTIVDAEGLPSAEWLKLESA